MFLVLCLVYTVHCVSHRDTCASSVVVECVIVIRGWHTCSLKVETVHAHANSGACTYKDFFSRLNKGNNPPRTPKKAGEVDGEGGVGVVKGEGEVGSGVRADGRLCRRPSPSTLSLLPSPAPPPPPWQLSRLWSRGN